MSKGWSLPGLIKLFKPVSSLLGVDISCSNVKLLELSKEAGKIVVKNYAAKTLPTGAIVGHTIKDPEAVAEVVRQVVADAKTSCTAVALAVPNSAVITKIVPMGNDLNTIEVENQLYLEAGKHIPYSLNEVNLDFEIRGPSAKNPELMDVLLVASRTENVSARAEIAELAGLTAQVIDVECYAVERAVSMLLQQQLPAAGKNKLIAVIDIGAEISNLTVLRDFCTVFVREESFGGAQLMEQIRRNQGATSANLNPGDAGFAELAAPYHDIIVQQMQRALQFFYSGSSDRKIDHIVLAGGTAKADGLAKLVTEKLGVSATVANPFMDIQIANNVDKAKLLDNAPALMTSLGLAMRSFKNGDN